MTPNDAVAAILSGAVVLSEVEADQLADFLRLAPRHRREERDRLLREAAAMMPGSTAAKAAGLATALTRYRASAWCREKDLPACPPHRQGKIEGLLWQCLRACDRGLSAATVRRILAA